MEMKKARRKHKRLAIFGLLMITLAVTTGFVGANIYLDRKVDIDTFYEGIWVDDIPLAGLTREEAIQKLYEKNQSRLDAYRIQLSHGDQVWTFTHKDINGFINIEETVDKAYELGRKGNFIERLKEIWRLKEEGEAFYTELSYDVDLLRDQVEEIAESLYVAPVDATISFYPDEKEKFVITNEAAGYELNVEEIMDQIRSGIKASPYLELELRGREIKPRVYAAELQEQTKRIAVFSTDLGNSSANRVHNVVLALKQFNGMVVEPGQEVSFNQTTGERTKENGYKAAPVIKADKSLEDDLGGGVCQSSSTLYNAVLYAGLEIVERTHHSFPSTYVDKGLDATVNWPNLDFVFKNNQDTPIYIRTYKEGNDVFVEIYGKPQAENQEIRLETEVYKTYSAPKPKVIEDKEQKYVKYKDQTYQKVLSRPGYKVRSYRVIYQDGKEVSRELLYDDFYKPITGVIYKGVLDRPQKVENPEKTPTKADEE